MAQLSYLRQIVGRTQGHLPLLIPPRPLFRPGEVLSVPETFLEQLNSSSLPHQVSSPADPTDRLAKPTATPLASPATPTIAASTTEIVPPTTTLSIEQQKATKSSTPQSPSNSLVEGRSASSQSRHDRSGELEHQPPIAPRRKSAIVDSESVRTTPLTQSGLQATAMPKTSRSSSQTRSEPEPTVILQPPRRGANKKTSLSERDTISEISQANRPSPQLLPAEQLIAPPSPEGNTVHIGVIEVHIVPPPAPPPLVSPRVVPVAAKPGLAPNLSRGFISTFGLRQG